MCEKVYPEIEIGQIDNMLYSCTKVEKTINNKDYYMFIRLQQPTDKQNNIDDIKELMNSTSKEGFNLYNKMEELVESNSSFIYTD